MKSLSHWEKKFCYMPLKNIYLSIFIYVKNREREKGRERKIFAILWFTLQITTRTSSLKLHQYLLRRLAWARALAPFCAASSTLAGSCIGSSHQDWNWHSSMGCWHCKLWLSTFCHSNFLRISYFKVKNYCCLYFN